jgi:hypothetical protein
MLLVLPPSTYNERDALSSRPSLALVITVLLLALLAMAAGVYFGGTGRTPLAMLGTFLFVALGGLAFELARRRSV